MEREGETDSRKMFDGNWNVERTEEDRTKEIIRKERKEERKKGETEEEDGSEVEGEGIVATATIFLNQRAVRLRGEVR